MPYDCRDKKIPKPNKYIDKGELMCLVNAAYLTEPTKRRFTTGFDSTFLEVQLFTGIKLNE